MTKKQALKHGLVFLATIGLFTLPLIYFQRKVGSEAIQQAIVDSGYWGPIIYIALRLVTHIVAPISGTPIIIAGLLAFGKWVIVYDYIVAATSGFTNFWIARIFGRNLVIKVVGREAMNKIDQIATHEGVKVLIIMRLFLGAFVDFISYAAGLTNIKFRPYYLITLLAPLPYTLIALSLFNFFDIKQLSLVSASIYFVVPTILFTPIAYFLIKRFSR
ncbi:MAG: VTT domain-containing protein [bacterium]|nr:VTT domain-containing protein [bacterium]